jgi:hypothetical protein
VGSNPITRSSKNNNIISIIGTAGRRGQPAISVENLQFWTPGGHQFPGLFADPGRLCSIGVRCAAGMR